MKKVMVYIIIVILITASFSAFAEEGERTWKQNDIIKDSTESAEFPPFQNKVTYLKSMEEFDSYDSFMKEVGYSEKDKDPSIDFYIRTILATGERFIFSNKDDEETIKRLDKLSDETATEIPQKTLSLTATSSNNFQAELPYSPICQLYITYYDYDNQPYTTGWGTGFFVGTNCIATSAHLLNDFTESGKHIGAKQIKIYYSFKDPNSGAQKFAVSNAVDWNTSSGYDVSDRTVTSVDNDYALLRTVSNPGDVSKICKLVPESINTSLTYRVLGFRGVGYSVEKTSYDTTPNSITDSTGAISNVLNKRFSINMNFYPGMSGGPIFRVSNNVNEVFGIGKGMYGTTKYATRITWDAYNFYNTQVGFRNKSIYQTPPSVKSAGVRAFQQYINSNLPIQYLGSYLSVDGGFGPASRTAAIKLLQYWLNTMYGAGLTIDGGFGPATRAAVHSVVQGDSGMGVYILQGLLYGNGYDPKGFDGSFGVSGGQGCLNAVKYFQSDEHLSVDGRAGPATFDALCN